MSVFTRPLNWRFRHVPEVDQLSGDAERPTGTDAFISYSRRDKEFVVRLTEALKAREKEAWVDWEGIIPGEEWLQKIYSAIEASQAVIVVLSPDAVASENCKLEVDHTTSLNKRLIPIVFRDVDPRDCPKAAAAQNWIFFRETDDFEAAVGLLIEAMETDLEWVRVHTQLLTRAIEWESNHRDSSYALSGREMRLAENWMLNAGLRKPHPIQVQIDYILTSRNYANTRRARAIAGGITILFAAAISLLVTEQNRQRANLYWAQDLRAQAISALTDHDAHTAEVLLAKSITLDDRESTRELFLDARSRAARLTRVIHIPASRVLALSPDGSAFVAARADGVTAVGHVDKATAEVGPPIEKAAPGASKFSWDGSLVALVMADKVDVYQTLSSKLRFSIPMKSGIVQCAAFSPDGKILATAGADLIITTWDARSGKRIRAYHGHRAEILQMAFSPDGRTLASGGWENTVLLWDVRSGRLLHRLIGHEDVLLSCSFSPDGQTLATGSWDNTTRFWNVATGRCTATIRGSNAGITAMAFTSDGHGLYTGSQLGTTRYCDVDAASVRLAIPSPNDQINALTALPDQRSVMTAGADGDIQVWDVGFRDRRPEVRTLQSHTGLVSSLSISHDSHFLASAGMDGAVKLWDLRTDACIYTFEGHTAGVEGVAFAPDGKSLASAGRDWTVRIWDIAGGMVRKVIPLLGPARCVAYVGNGATFAVTSDDGFVRLYDTETGALVKSEFIGYQLYSLAVSPSGRMIALGMGDGEIHLRSASTLARVADLYDRSGQVWGVAFAPDGQRLYAGTGDVLAAWDLRKRKIVRRLTASSSIWALAVDPDGSHVATACEDASVLLWDMRNGSHIMLSTSDASLSSIAWAPDGASVVAGGLDHAIRVWNVALVQDMLEENPTELFDEVEQATGLTVGDQQVVPLPITSLHQSKVTTCRIGT